MEREKEEERGDIGIERDREGRGGWRGGERCYWDMMPVR